MIVPRVAGLDANRNHPGSESIPLDGQSYNPRLVLNSELSIKVADLAPVLGVDAAKKIAEFSLRRGDPSRNLEDPAGDKVSINLHGSNLNTNEAGDICNDFSYEVGNEIHQSPANNKYYQTLEDRSSRPDEYIPKSYLKKKFSNSARLRGQRLSNTSISDTSFMNNTSAIGLIPAHVLDSSNRDWRNLESNRYLVDGDARLDEIRSQKTKK
jgi:hypothetical protein